MRRFSQIRRAAHGERVISVYSSPMRESLAIWLLLLTVALPAIDSVYCPDGCTDSSRSAMSWHADEAADSQSCGLCVNAVAVHRAVAIGEPTQRFIPLASALALEDVSIPLRSIDRPPRRA
jgi:hypothetical protein